MKICPQCSQAYDDDTNFCLNDGATLIASTAATTAPQIEMPTVIRSSPAVIPIQQTFEQPFQQPFQTPAVPAVQAGSGGGSGLLYLVVALIVLLLVGGAAGLGLYFLRGSSSGPEVTSNQPATDSGSTAGGKSADGNRDNENRREDLGEEKEKLRADQEKLDAEKRRLEEERKALEQKKKQTPLPTPPPAQDNFRTAYIIDPPSNVRATPNGRIICVIRGLNTPIRIIGYTGVRDGNGAWYYTNACGGRGVIHSTQFRY
jgi:hypothetical protein